MKNKEIISGVVGGIFFAVPYLALTLPAIPSILIGGAAFGATELLFTSKESLKLKEYNRSLYNTLKKAKDQNRYIAKMTSMIDDKEICADLSSINDNVSKIISTIEENPKKGEKINNFFDYYLPVTTRIIDQYNSIEDKDISSKDGKSFVVDSKKMIHEINISFEKLLNSLYTKDITNVDADMKVLNTMLKADGWSSEELGKEDTDE